MMSLKRRELFVFHQPGCVACAQALPLVDAWAARHYADVLVVQVDLTMWDGEKYDFTPKATPAYLYAEDGERVRDYTGPALKGRELDDFTRSPE